MNGAFRRLAAGLFLAALPAAGAQAQDAAQVARGEKIYAETCASCHGEKLKNTSGGATFDLRLLTTSDHARFVGAVTDGRNGMPPWGAVLDSGEIEAVWTYIMALKD